VVLITYTFLCWVRVAVAAVHEVNLPLQVPVAVQVVAAVHNAVLCFRLGPYQMCYTFQLVRAVRVAL
jgi:hypothetical protein